MLNLTNGRRVRIVITSLLSPSRHLPAGLSILACSCFMSLNVTIKNTCIY